jgi:iron(III) transport system permease protein
MVLNFALGRSARVRVASGKGVSPRPFLLGRARWPLFAAVGGAACAVVALPLAAVILVSVQRHFGAPLRVENFTLEHWRAVWSQHRTLAAAGRSLALAAAAGIVVTAFGAAIALSRKSLGRVGAAIASAAVWPYAVPGTVLAMALLMTFARDFRFVLANRIAFVLALANTPWLVLAAYSAKYLALGERNATEGLAQMDPSLVEAARMSGAAPWRAALDVTLPLLRPALAASFLLAFLSCATEITMSVLLVPPGTDLLGPLLFELQSYADPAAAAVLACGLVLIVIAARVGVAAAERARASARALGRS